MNRPRLMRQGCKDIYVPCKCSPNSDLNRRQFQYSSR